LDQALIKFSSFVLNFAYCELLETRGDNEAVHNIFDKLLNNLSAELETIEARVKADSPNSSQNVSGNLQPNVSNGNIIPNNGPTPGITNAGIESKDSSFETRNSDIPPKSDALAERRADYGLVWIMYMRFARRAESLKSSRAVFSKSRKSRFTPWEVYEAAGEFPQLISVLDNDEIFSSDGVPCFKGRGCPQQNIREGDGILLRGG
jgi:cleavage stimulation factor subunit 3